MTRRDFQLIADVLAEARVALRLDPVTHTALVWRFADALAQTNERFDPGRFETAAVREVAMR